MLNRRNRPILVWNSLRASKRWPNFHFWVVIWLSLQYEWALKLLHDILKRQIIISYSGRNWTACKLTYPFCGLVKFWLVILVQLCPAGRCHHLRAKSIFLHDCCNSWYSYKRPPSLLNSSASLPQYFAKSQLCFLFCNIKYNRQDRHIFPVSGFCLFPWAQKSRSAELLQPHWCFCRVEGNHWSADNERFLSYF